MPEAMYRFLTLFSSVPNEDDLLYQCMTQDFFYAGFDIVDSQVISRYAAPMVRQSQMALHQEKAAYQEALGQQRLTELEDGLDRIPDEEKPFYSMQFAFYVARQEAKQRQAAEERAKRVGEAKTLSEKEQREYQRLKAKAEEKRKKNVKRQRQAKSRRKGR